MNGLSCPVCGTHLHEVLRTEQRQRRTLRFRECANKHRFKSEERVVGVHRRDKVKTQVIELVEKARKLSVIERRAWGLTVNGIAETVGVSRETVYRIMRGEEVRRKPRNKRKGKST